ncbi:MAG: hypothetical protein NTW05_23935 [Pseudonocardiales bacterium]|nr:hypothetical protein [Pseudonocardiales bacterium]
MTNVYFTDDGSVVALSDDDGDGYQETTRVDHDGDGEVDVVLVDSDGDTHDDVALFDNSSGDRTFDPDVHAFDTDGDGRADIVYDDLDYDGDIDRVTGGGGARLADANPYGPDLQDIVDSVYDRL